MIVIGYCIIGLILLPVSEKATLIMAGLGCFVFLLALVLGKLEKRGLDRRREFARLRERERG